MAQKVFVKAASSLARLSGNDAITVKTLHFCSAATGEMLGGRWVHKNGKKSISGTSVVEWEEATLLQFPVSFYP